MISSNFVVLKLPRKAYISLRYHYRGGYSIKVTLCANFGQLDFFQQLILYIAVFLLYYTLVCLCCVENKVSCLFDKIIWKMIHDTNIFSTNSWVSLYCVQSKSKKRQQLLLYFIFMHRMHRKRIILMDYYVILFFAALSPSGNIATF